MNSFHDIKKNNQMKMNELQFEKKKNLEKKGSFKNSLSSLEKNEENKTVLIKLKKT